MIPNITINLTITTAEAAEQLLKSLCYLGNGNVEVAQQPAPIEQPAMQTPIAPTQPTPTVPVQNMPPVAPPPTFSVEQIGRAGADLVAANPAKMPELINLLAQFGVQSIVAVKPEQLGAFATALRGLGAKI